MQTKTNLRQSKSNTLNSDDFDLIYVTDSKMPIFRNKRDEKFEYLLSGQILTDEAHLERIDKLVIPPAWQDVKITHLHNGHLQATGRDSKYRKQYRYHTKWSKIRNRNKFYNMYLFGQYLPKIRKQVDVDLVLDGWPKRRIVALIIRLMEETYIRIGNVQYAKRNKTYGLSTLRKRHLDIYKDKLRFEFVGKKGKTHKVTLRNKKLVRLVSQCEEIPGWELFKYYNKDGDKKVVDSSLVNDYIHDISGQRFSAKDFRTWAASLVYFDTLYDLGISENKKEQQTNSLKALDEAAKALGNSRNVCRKYYVHPTIEKAYLSNSILPYFDLVTNEEEQNDFYSASEIALLILLKEKSYSD